MKFYALVLCAIVAFSSPAVALTPPASATIPHANLSTPYAAALGDVIAFTMTQLVAVVKSNERFLWRIDGPVVITYDHTSTKLVVSVFGDPPTGGYGSPGGVDKAKAALEYFRAKAFPVISTCIGKSYGVSLDDSDLTLVYFNSGTMKEVLRREGARYLVSE